MGDRKGQLQPYVPRVATEWDSFASGSLHRSVNGTLLFVDISGFTNLSERLARRGRVGAEELTAVLDRVFGEMLELVYERGGSLLKFGGDALLLIFGSDDSVMQATAAAVEMRAALRNSSKEKTSVGRIDLKMSSGIHSGSVDFFLVGQSHRELLVSGPTASTTTAMESTAEAGEIVVSSRVAEQLPAGFVGDAKGDGWLLRKQKVNHPPAGRRPRAHVEDLDIASFVPLRLRGQLEAGITESEHRLATIGFLKFQGVDDMLESQGAEKVAEALDALVSVTQQAADTEGVTFLASDIDANGGKIILAAGVPTSQHDDEGRILRAARRVLDADLDLDVKIGINRGHVFAGDVGTTFRRTFTVMGDTVNLAARLMASAPPGGLYSSPAALDGSSTLFRAEALPPFQVKGKTKPVTAYSVFEEIGTRPPETKHELPFHGREAELEMIVSIVTTCARIGRGGMMTVSGDTGIGKSRLIAEVMERCPGLATLILKAEPNGSENPYWAFRDPLRRKLGIRRTDMPSMARSLRAVVGSLDKSLVPLTPLLGDVVHVDVPDNETTAAIDPQFRPDRTADLIIELLSKLHREPIAVVVEDAQWLDEASKSLLLRLGQAAESRPWSVMATMRDADDSEFDTLGEEIALGALDDATIRQIAIEATMAAPLRPHELEGIVSRVGGNPLFLSEILSAIRDAGGADDIPETLDAVVSAQIDTLPPLARQTLRYSSVLGTSFPTVVLERLLEPDGIEIDAATRAELDRFLDADPSERWRFKHAVVHDVAYQGLPYRRRRELHGRAAEVVEHMSSADPSASAEFLAYHFSEAGRHEKAWEYGRVAADRAKSTYANTEAAAHYRRALDAVQHVAGVGADETSDVWRKLGEVHELSGQFESARESYGRALRANGTDPQRVVDLHILRAGAWMNSGRLSQAKRDITLGRKSLIGSDDRTRTRLLSRLDAFEASVQASSGDPVAAAEAATRAVDRARTSGEEEALARAYGVLDWANFALGRDEPRRGQDAIEIYQKLGFVERSVGLMNNLGVFEHLDGNWDEARTWYLKAVEAAERSGNVVEAARTRANIAEVLVGQRRFDEAMPFIAEAQRVYMASNVPDAIPFVRMVSARVALGRGDVDSAVDSLEQLFDEQMDHGDTSEDPEIVVYLAEALVAVGRPGDALDRLERFQNVAPDDAQEVAVGISRTRAAALRALARHADADEEASNALAMARDEGDLLAEALLLEDGLEERGRVGLEPDPTQVARLSQLFDQLGVVDPASEPLASGS